MRRRAPPIPEHLRHVLVEVESGVELRTWSGYVIKAFATREEAMAYLGWHCPGD